VEYYTSSTVLFLDPEQSTLCVTIEDISQFKEIDRDTGIFLMLNLDLDYLGPSSLSQLASLRLSLVSNQEDIMA
jgi:hypothetical protein